MRAVPIEDRFWSKVDKNGPVPDDHPELGPCWLWIAYCQPAPNGYGAIGSGRRSLLAHRVAWKLVNGPIPDGQWVLHSCDNPPCVNPAHHFLGSPAANAQDRAAKGRSGERSPRRKLTIQQVRAIRAHLEAGLRQTAIADEFGVDQTLISAIKRGVAWAHYQ